jgi:hypothetical protein
MTVQRFSGQGYHKIVDKTATTNILFQLTVQIEGSTVYLYATNADLTTTNPADVTDEINPHKFKESITEYFYTNNLDLWVYFSSDDGYLILPDNPVVNTVNASIDPVKLSTINPAHFPLGGGGGGTVTASDVSTSDGSNVQVKIDELETATSTNASNISDNTSDISTNASAIATNTSDIATNTSAIADLQSLTPFLSVADTTASVTISTTADTTFMQFLATNQSQNDTAYFSYATDTLTILQSGLYNFNIGVNAEKSGGGSGDLEIKFLVNDVLGKNAIGLIQIDNDGTIASGFSGSVILNANDTVKIVFQNQGTGTLTATTTATQDAFRLQVFKIGN